MKKINYILIALALILMVSTVAAEEMIVVSLLNQDPDPASAGDIVEIRFKVENIGDTATGNYFLEFSPQYPFEAIPGENNVMELGKLNINVAGDNAKIVKFKARINRDATAGSYNVPILAYVEGNRRADEKRLFNINIKSMESAEVIYIDKTSLVPGEENTLKFTINNVGNSPLKDITFKWLNNEKVILPIGSDNTKYIKYIDVGDSAELSYRVIADSNAKPGLYELSLQLQYQDQTTGVSKELSTIAGVYIGGETDFRVAFSESTAEETSFSVANTGSNPAYSISVTIPKQDGWTIKKSNSVIVGNLEKGDYTVAGFVLQPTRQGDGIPLKIQIEYTDTAGKSHVVEKEVLLDSSSIAAAGLTSGSNTMPSNPLSGLKNVGIGILVIIVAIIGYKYYRKRKNNSKK